MLSEMTVTALALKHKAKHQSASASKASRTISISSRSILVTLTIPLLTKDFDAVNLIRAFAVVIAPDVSYARYKLSN